MRGMRFIRGEDWSQRVEAHLKMKEEIEKKSLKEIKNEESKLEVIHDFKGIGTTIARNSLKNMSKSEVENELFFNHKISNTFMNEFTVRELKKILTICRNNDVSTDDCLSAYLLKGGSN